MTLEYSANLRAEGRFGELCRKLAQFMTALRVEGAAVFPPGGGKTIVLTGAMVPYAFGSSDGLFNLGSALSFVQVLTPGVYIAMNGRAFKWNQVTKNRDTGVFESV